MRAWLVIDLLSPCRRELAREKAKLRQLREEHRGLAERAVRHAGNAKEALEGVSILMTADEVDRLFERRNEDRKRDQDRKRDRDR
jgi:hypothetical protein